MTKTTDSTPTAGAVGSESGPWVIEVQRSTDPCWLCDMDGDPGRTGVLASAKRWKSKRRAFEALLKVRDDYPRRIYQIVPLALAEKYCGNAAHPSQLGELLKQATGLKTALDTTSRTVNTLARALEIAGAPMHPEMDEWALMDWARGMQRIQQ